MDNNNTIVLSVEQARTFVDKSQLFNQLIEDNAPFSAGEAAYIAGYNSRNEEVKELIGALEKMLIQGPEADYHDHKRLYTEAYNTLTKYTNK